MQIRKNRAMPTDPSDIEKLVKLELGTSKAAVYHSDGLTVDDVKKAFQRGEEVITNFHVRQFAPSRALIHSAGVPSDTYEMHRI